MEKKYMRPAIKVQTIDMDGTLLAASTLGNNPTDIDSNAPGNGGDSNGSQTVGAKQNTFNVWDDED